MSENSSRGQQNIVKNAEEDMINLVDNLNRDNDLKYNRRAFIKSIVAASVTVGLATVPFQILSHRVESSDGTRKKIVDLSQLQKGQSFEFNYPDEAQPALLIHKQDGNLIAFNNKCTHLQCPVFYQSEEGKEQLICPCHRGFFDLEGQPTGGPPQRELPKITLEIKDGVVYAVGREVRHG